jgi:elongation factor P
MITVTDLRNGAAFTENNQIFKVLKYEFTKMGRGTATIKVKIKNLRNGSIIEKSFISGAKVQEIFLDKKEVQYLYKDKNDYVFMEPRTFEQFSVDQDKMGEEKKYLQEGIEVNLLMYQNEALSLELPIKMDFKVKETDPGVKGNSATNIYKDAMLENGVHLRVPLFVQEGDIVRIDTRTGEYVERVGN